MTEQSERDALAADLAVSETWFIRGGRLLFERLAGFLADRAGRSSGGRVRALSAPCSSGEEPYSLAIALHERLLTPDEYAIDAVDQSARVLAKAADALPGVGIVAAVLGIIVTMGAIDGPASEIGHKVGAALVGTFLGILLSYGFFAPLAGRMEFLGAAEATFLRAIAVAVLAMSEGENNREALARVRRTIGTDCRPSLAEMNQIFSQE